MYSNRLQLVACGIAAIFLAGCGSAYKGMVDQSGLGAGQYIPAVYVEPGQEAKYQQVLAICRQAAVNRQMTAAQEAQLKTLTQSAESTVAGAAAAVEMSQIFDMAEFDVDVGDQALVGAGVGLLTGVVGAMAGGTETAAAETKAVLLRCLDAASQGGKLWQVLE
ncbi:MAG: hypothetical protein OXI79_00050 [Gammaproteobacteria bacterium]|nr:hypothetical protein [Gammaproteobacteria bacterium]